MSDAPRTHPALPRLLELLAAESIGDLSEREAAELASLRAETPPITDERGAPATAAQAGRTLGALLAASAAPEAGRSLSPRLRAAIIADGVATVGAAVPGTSALRPRGLRPLIGPVGWAGWAAAVVATAFFLWQVVVNQPPDGEDRLAEVIEEGAVRIAIAPESGSGGGTVDGEIIWSADGQEGFLHVHGLAANDPSLQQYQAWVVDAARGAAAPPIDCGVFDAGSGFTVGGERYVPLRAKLAVTQPAKFLITVEPPGGVVVSSLQRLVASGVVPPSPLKGRVPGDSDSHWPPR